MSIVAYLIMLVKSYFGLGEVYLVKLSRRNIDCIRLILLLRLGMSMSTIVTKVS